PPSIGDLRGDFATPKSAPRLGFRRDAGALSIPRSRPRNEMKSHCNLWPGSGHGESGADSGGRQPRRKPKLAGAATRTDKGQGKEEGAEENGSFGGVMEWRGGVGTGCGSTARGPRANLAAM